MESTVFNLVSSKHPLWGLAFRPFFFFASMFAALNVVLWSLIYSGVLSYSGNLPILTWHIREMLIGFAGAVIVGFLMTASQNWTGIPGVSGKKLQLLFCVWFLGRLVPWFSVDIWIVYSFDAVFWLLSFYFLYPYLSVPTQRRNLVFLACFIFYMITGYFLLGAQAGDYRLASVFVLSIVMLVISIIAGRVLPFFTNSAIPGAQARRLSSLDWASHIGIFLLPFFLLDILPSWLSSLSIYVVAAIHLLRLLFWKPWKSISKPILWILHLSYLWLVLGVASLAHVANQANHSLGIHMITIGCVGGLILGMMSRVSLGHTGRPLQVSRPVVLGYVLIQVSVGVRVFLPLYDSSLALKAIQGSSLLWAAAFSLFCIQYFPILFSPRADGKPG